MSALDPPAAALFTYGLAPDWRRYSFDWQAGRPAVFILAPSGQCETLRSLLENFVRLTNAFTEKKTDVLVLAAAGSAQVIRQWVAQASIEVIECAAALLAPGGTASSEALTVVVDRNLRVALQCEPDDPQHIVAACLGCIDRLMRETPAPVLVLPNLLKREFCQILIARFENGNSNEGKVAGIDSRGLPYCYVDHSIKRRRDLTIPLDDPLYPIIREMLLVRCVPEIEKAFQTKVAYIDRLMLARYDSPSGGFHRHRDNATANTEFREFAISVNLNTEDYDGGFLRFPEYSDQPYCPPTGAGIIFSASLLHEVVPVSRGHRYALLTFFHGEAAENLRRRGNTKISAG